MLRRLHIAALATVAFVAGVGCGPTPTPEPPEGHAAEMEVGRNFISSRLYRRDALRVSLVNPTNGYAQLRLQKYTGEWNDLEVWNPPVRPVTTDDIGAFDGDAYRQSEGDFAETFDERPSTHEEWLALGRRAFETYPLQIDMTTGAATDSQQMAERFGLWTDDRDRVGGLVRVRLPGDREAFAKTCATCHASPNSDGALVHGRTNAAFDRGALLGDHRPGPGGKTPADWGPGQIDVTPDERFNPTAIIDLRPIRLQNHLHWAGTLNNSLAALAIRIDTLLITSLNQQLRPPRTVSFALAYYLWHMEEPPARWEPATLNDRQSRGAKVFDEQCSRCHHARGTTAPPVLLERVGTDPAVGESPMRGTGRYRIPSLRGVADRTQYLHTGSVATLEELFAPERLETTPGHTFGTALSADDRRALVAYLQTL